MVKLDKEIAISAAAGVGIFLAWIELTGPSTHFVESIIGLALGFGVGFIVWKNIKKPSEGNTEHQTSFEELAPPEEIRDDSRPPRNDVAIGILGLVAIVFLLALCSGGGGDDFQNFRRP